MAKEVPVRSAFGISADCPFRPDETPQERHARRHASAMRRLADVRAWCEYRGVEFRVAGSNHPETTVAEGWKWDFRVPDKFAQWRPFVGKLSLKRNLRGQLFQMKVYGVDQLLVALEWWLEKES